MWSLVINFFQSMLDTAMRDTLAAISDVFADLFHSAFFIERTPGLGSVLSEVTVSQALSGLYYVMVLLLTAKLIWKGWKVYVLWRDGESETPPTELLIGGGLAIVTAIAFPTLYELGTEIIWQILDIVLQSFSFSGSDNSGINIFLGVLNLFDDIKQIANQVDAIILIFTVYAVMLVVSSLSILGKGVELLVYRLGVPIAASGLVDSDGGVWKMYLQSLFRMFASVMVQYLLLILGIRVMAQLTILNIILGIVLEFMSMSAPRMISQFLLPTGGGQSGGTIQTLLMAGRMFVGG